METYVFISQGLLVLAMAAGGFNFKRLWDEVDSHRKEAKESIDVLRNESKESVDSFRSEMRQEMESFRLQIKHTSDRVGNLNMTLIKDYPTKSDLRDDLYRLEKKVDELGSKMEKGMERIFNEFFGPKPPSRED